jgi:hypothetical protein
MNNELTIVTKAVQILLPDVPIHIDGTDYDNIHILDDTVKPTRAQVEAKIQELKAAEPMRLLRVHRDKLLAETDWVTMRSYSTNTPVPEEWASYQQALRDLPNTAIPVLDPTSPLGISGVDWPVKPQ